MTTGHALYPQSTRMHSAKTVMSGDRSLSRHAHNGCDFSFWSPQLAASFISIHMCNGRYWHLADIVGAATFCPLLDHNGQRSILVLQGLSANDPSATLVVRCGNSFDAGFDPLPK